MSYRCRSARGKGCSIDAWYTPRTRGNAGLRGADMRKPFGIATFLIFLATVASVGVSTAAGARALPPKPKEITGSISGHVYQAHSNAPIANASVSVTFTSPNTIIPQFLETPTAADGSFSFADLEPGIYTVFAEAGAFFSEARSGATELGAGKNIGNMNLRLEPAGALSGTVTDKNGNPIQGMSVSLFEAKNPKKGTDLGGILTDDRGHFRITSVMPGDWYVATSIDEILKASSPGLTFYPDSDSTAKAQIVTVKPGSETADLRLSVEAYGGPPRDSKSRVAPGSISGHIYRTDTNAPLSGVIVTLRQPGRVFSIETVPVPMPPTKWALTGDDGGYSFPSLAPGNYEIGARRFGFIGDRSYNITRPVTVEGTAVDNVNGRLQPASVIAGEVSGPDGDPLSQMNVEVFKKVGDKAVQTAETITNSAGTFSVAVPVNESYYVAVGKMGNLAAGNFSYPPTFYPNAESLEQAQTVVAEIGKDIPELHFAMKKIAGRTVTIRFEMPHGDPNAYFNYTLKKQNDSQQKIQYLQSFLDSPRGQFGAANTPIHFRGVLPGTYTVEVTKANLVRGPNGNMQQISQIKDSIVATGTVSVNSDDMDVTISQASSGGQPASH